LAQKDLSVSVEVQSTDEVGRLSDALNRSVAATREVLRNIALAAETLSAATEELSVRSTETSGNAKTQSASTNQIAAAAQEMVATIGEISHNAEEATNVSRQSADSARLGREVMQKANATMERIGETSSSVADRMNTLARRSEEIGNVVSVIQGISEQTNLLALNAALKRRAPVSMAAALRWWPAKCGGWRSVPRARPRRLQAPSAASRKRRGRRWT